jgi:hypothetical protein
LAPGFWQFYLRPPTFDLLEQSSLELFLRKPTFGSAARQSRLAGKTQIREATLFSDFLKNINANGAPMDKMGIPMKVVSDSDLIPVTCSEVKAVVFGAKRRWRSYGA